MMQKQHGQINENAKVVTREKEEGWIKPIKCTPIAHFCKKFNKNNEKDKNINRHNRLGEDNEIENIEHEEELSKKNKRDGK